MNLNLSSTTRAESPDYIQAVHPRRGAGQYKLILPLVSAELKAECGHTFGGLLWWFVDPLLSILVFYVAFSYVLQSGGADFIAFLCVGTLIWRWFHCSVVRGCGAILDASDIMHKVYVHKGILVAVCLVADAFKFLITLLPLFLLIVLFGNTPTVHWSALFILVTVQAIFTTAVVGCTAAVTPFMPDLKNLIQHALQLLVFISGVFFQVDLVSPTLRPLVMLNPMAGLIQGYRDCLLYQKWPDLTYLAWVTAFSLIGILISWTAINRFDREYTKIC